MAQAAQSEIPAQITEVYLLLAANWNVGHSAAYRKMAQTFAAQLVRVITDDLEYQIWVTATSREEAVSRVLDCVPEGWSASLLEPSLSPNEAAVLKLQPGDVRKLKK